MTKREEVRLLRSQGLSLGEISIRVGLVKSAVSYYCSDLKLSSQQKVDLKSRMAQERTSKAEVRRSLVKEKYCPSCKKTKPLDDFHKRGAYPMGYCKVCQCSRVNKDKSLLRSNFKEIIQKAKSGKSCVDCGGVYPYWIMDFDHLDPKLKLFEISRASKYCHSVVDLVAEIAKCELVCANCHRYRHYVKHDGT